MRKYGPHCAPRVSRSWNHILSRSCSTQLAPQLVQQPNRRWRGQSSPRPQARRFGTAWDMLCSEIDAHRFVFFPFSHRFSSRALMGLFSINACLGTTSPWATIKPLCGRTLCAGVRMLISFREIVSAAVVCFDFVSTRAWASRVKGYVHQPTVGSSTLTGHQQEVVSRRGTQECVPLTSGMQDLRARS